VVRKALFILLSISLTCAARPPQLPAPQTTDDAGDFYVLPGGAQVKLLRARDEIGVRYNNDRQINLLRGPLDLRAVQALPTVHHAYPVLVEPKSRTRMIPTDEILVRLSPGTKLPKLAGIADAGPVALGVRRLRLLKPKHTDPLAVARTLAAQPGVVWAVPNFVRELRLCFTPDDPLFDQQQALQNTGQNGAVSNADVDACGAWDVSTGSNGIVIAIIDDGVDTNHTDLAFAPGGYNFAAGTSDPNPTNSNGHGTGCAGVAAGIINNNRLIAGIAGGCRVLPINIVDTNGVFTTDENIGTAIAYAADHADVLSDSWGGGAPSPFIDDAINYAVTAGRGGKGCPVFFATGNFASTWNQGGSRYRINLSGFGGDLYLAFFYRNGGDSNGEETVRIDNVCLLDTNGYTHLTGTMPDEDFEGAVPGWWVYGDGLWSLSTSNTFTGTGGALSAASPPLTNSQRAWLFTPLLHLTGQETLAFSYSTSISTNSNFYLLLYDSSLAFIAGADLSNGVPNVDSTIFYPASQSNTIAVGAATDCDFRSDYSEYDGKLDFVAPSNGGWNDITTLDPSGAVGWTSTDFKSNFGGTSSATPLAAGTAALMLSVNPGLTAGEVREILRATCDKIGGVTYVGGTNLFYGSGRLNARRAVEQSRVDLAVSQQVAVTCTALTYSVTVSNLGPARASSVTLTDALPAGVTFISATGACSTDATGHVACDLGSLASNGVATVQIVSTASVGTMTNLVGVAGDAVDANPADNSSVAVTDVFADTDCDGLPDAWELAFFGNLNQTGSDDPDGDGFTNLQEYLAGSDPTNSASSLAIIDATGNFTFTFRSVAGKSYVVQRCDDLRIGGWVDFTNLTAAGSLTPMTDAEAASLTQRFYRVRLAP
jgi:uncharacterized repeat protein (TIGR01451 family)